MAQLYSNPCTVLRSGSIYCSCLLLEDSSSGNTKTLQRAHPVFGGQILRHSLVVVLAAPLRPAVYGGGAEAARDGSHAPGPRARAPHSGQVPQREQRPCNDACAGAHDRSQPPQSKGVKDRWSHVKDDSMLPEAALRASRA